MGTWKQLSDELADAVEAAARHLVTVRLGRHRATGIAWSADRVITAAHLLRRANGAELRQDDRTWEATLVGRDVSGVALLRIEGGDLEPATWAASSAIRPGTIVLALGRGSGGMRAARGLVGGVGPAWKTRWGGQLARFLDIDGSLPGGFSGGPLVGPDGWLGMNTADLVPGGTTVPVETLLEVVARLERGGAPGRGYLGVSTLPAPVPPDLAEAAGQDRGVLVIGLEPDGPGPRAGLLQGDLVLSVGGSPMGDVRDLIGALVGRADETVELRVVRAGAVQDVEVALGRRGVAQGTG